MPAATWVLGFQRLHADLFWVKATALAFKLSTQIALLGAALGDGFTVGIDGSENAEFWNFENTNMLFATNGTERMRLDSSGNVGIGDNAFIGVVRLDVRSNAAATLGDFRNASATGFGLYVAAGDTSSQYAFRAADYQNNALFSVMGDGNVGIPGRVLLKRLLM